MKYPIVVGVDGSPSALQAVRWAAEEAKRRGVPLRLVNVYSTPIGLPGGIVEPAVVQKALNDQGKLWLNEARQVAHEVSGELRPQLVLMTASVVPALVKESLNASLLVLGTRGLGGFTGLLIGSTAVLLAGRVHCPMVVVRGTEPVQGPVVVGVDGTPKSEAAVAFAFAEASLHGTDLVAVHTWADTAVDTVLLGHPEPPDFEPAQQRAYETLAERLAGWQEKYPDVHVAREVVRDHPSRALLRYAGKARLVVVGTRGRGGFQGLVLGSTGQHLLHHAPCPVVVVHTEPDHQE
ncbi:universal stress protein [Actinophytocola oryzae]|uniref:Nucleotide-binding universal stress UspA family protein n=1 Tax=Actinophytocola oryzae TaxID=502181 RepID=A0A4R7V1P1_9PSEU|nr:universal stress protein [Actinophytocola oryzae]TDV42534.1 nucleotide-binding universal stress UspA family protein [Actinophytocola oryzae]